VIDANGANERFLRAGWNPTWSPDGTKIAFQTGIGSGGVYVMNADGSSPRLLISHEFASPGWGDYCACSPAWSPDGRTIAFVRANYEDAWAIYTLNADGSGSPTPLPGNGWWQGEPAWSRDGSRIAFETSSFGGDEVASVTPSGSDYRVHVTHATGYAGNPAWAPDGRRLLFTRSSPRGAPTRIFIVGEDGSVGQLIPEAQSPAKADYWDREPAWSWAD
jgi:Tol biopolymer transport system component